VEARRAWVGAMESWWGGDIPALLIILAVFILVVLLTRR
jgi:hypothetical protein